MRCDGCVPIDQADWQGKLRSGVLGKAQWLQETGTRYSTRAQCSSINLSSTINFVDVAVRGEEDHTNIERC